MRETSPQLDVGVTQLDVGVIVHHVDYSVLICVCGEKLENKNFDQKIFPQLGHSDLTLKTYMFLIIHLFTYRIWAY